MRLTIIMLAALLAVSFLGVACNSQEVAPTRLEYRADTPQADHDVPVGPGQERLEIYTGTY